MHWFDRVTRNIADAEAICEGETGTRDALLGLWLTMELVPEQHRDSYAQIPEVELAAEAADLDFRAIFTPPDNPSGRAPAIRGLVRDLAVRIRALELHLIELNDGSRSRTPSGNLATFAGYTAYLVLMPPKTRVPKDRQPFRLRGLASSRLIPTSLHEFRVELVVPRDARGRLRRREEAGLVVGAGLFEGLELDQINHADGFIIRDARAPNQLAVIEAHLAMADKSKCTGVVYPEFTIGHSTLSDIVQRLSDGSWETGRISMIVAGSRHQNIDGGGFFNVATILDGYGETITDHRKLYSYSDHDLVEAIELGDTLHIVLLENTLFAFGICLDYCNPRVAPPYLDLDVDFILVPSCGEEKTMAAHIERSSEVMRNLRTHTLVVQQYHTSRPPPDPPLGYILARADRDEPTLQELATTEPWHVKTI